MPLKCCTIHLRTVPRRVATGAMSPVVAHPLVQGWCRGIWGADGRGLRTAGDAPGDAQRRGRPPACLLASRRSHMGAGASGQRRPEDARAGDLAGNVHRGRAGQGRGRSDQPEPDGRERAGQAGPDGGGTGPAVRPGRRDWFGVRGALKREPVYAARVWSRVAADLIPALGHKDVGEITSEDVLAVLQKIEDGRIEDRGAVYSAKTVGRPQGYSGSRASPTGLRSIRPKA